MSDPFVPPQPDVYWKRAVALVADELEKLPADKFDERRDPEGEIK